MLTDDLIPDGNGPDLVMIHNRNGPRRAYVGAGAAADAPARGWNDMGVPLPVGEFQGSGADDFFADAITQTTPDTPVRQWIRVKAEIPGDADPERVRAFLMAVIVFLAPLSLPALSRGACTTVSSTLGLR